MKNMNLFVVIIIAIHTLSCRPIQKGRAAELAASSADAPSNLEVQRGKNFLTCDADNNFLTNCRIDSSRPVIASLVRDPDPKVEVDIKILYSSKCPTGRHSSIEAVSSNSSGEWSAPLNFMTPSGETTIRGSTSHSVTLVDRNPTATADIQFSSVVGCDLIIKDVIMTPSDLQVAHWASDAKNYSQTINDKITIYSDRKEVQNWYQSYIADPTAQIQTVHTAISGVIANRIKSLSDPTTESFKSPGEQSRDKLLVASLNTLITSANVQLDDLIKPYGDAKSDLMQVAKEARDFVSVLCLWKSAVEDALTAALGRSDNAVAQ